jgi:selenocysteine lyase/cysteine desulfurase
MSADHNGWVELRRHVRSRIDNEFELDRKLIHLNTMLIASPPRRVRDAIRAHQEAFNRDPAGYFFKRIRANGPVQAAHAVERVAQCAAEYLGLGIFMRTNQVGGTSLIAQTESTTMGLALLANGIDMKVGDEVLISSHAFFSWRDAWKLRRDRGSIRYREFRLYGDPANTDLENEIIGNVENEVRDNTRVLALTWVHSSTGVKLPIRRICDRIQKINSSRASKDRIIICVDGVHGFGVEDRSFMDLACDFFVAGCHKWLFGPRGTGIICALPGAWCDVMPTVPSFLPMSAPGAVHTPGGVQNFEYKWALAEAFEFHLDMGKTAIEKYTHRMASRLKKGLASIAGVHVVTPMDECLSSGIVCCDAGMDAKQAEDALRRAGIAASRSSEDPDGKTLLRFSPSILNTEEEIDRTLNAVADITNS